MSSESIGSGPSSALDSTFGAVLVGLLFSTFFQGMLTVQAYNYYEDFPRDPLRIKLTVALVWTFDTINLVLIAQSTYHYLITNWGYQPALAYSTWEIIVQLIFIGLSTFVCQIFFLNRIWVFSERNIPIVGSILAICLATFGLHILVTVQLLQIPLISEIGTKKTEIIGVFTLGAAADILIAGFLCYYLLRDQSDFHQATKSLIGKILQYAVGAGLATSALAIASLVAYFIQQQGFYFMAIHFCLGRMYTSALLITLNARHKLRMSLYSNQKSGMGGIRSARFTRQATSVDRIMIDHSEVADSDDGFSSKGAKGKAVLLDNRDRC